MNRLKLNKRKLVTLLIAILLLFTACSVDAGNKARDEKKSKKGSEETMNLDDLIGKEIDISEGTITLPFDDQVSEAVFSEDGTVMILRTPAYVVVVDGEEIIRVDKVKSYSELVTPMVSNDGRFVTWRGHQDDWEISVYDVENRQLDVVEEDEEQDPYGVGDEPLIEKHDDTYFLMDNLYMFGYEIDKALDLLNKRIYSFGNPDDEAMLEKLSPKSRTTDEDVYVEIENKMYRESLDRGNEGNLASVYTNYGNYEVFYDYEEDKDEHSHITKMFGVDVKKGAIFDVLDEAGIELGKDKARLQPSELSIAENGHVLLPIFEQYPDETDMYKMFVYHIDLSEKNPEDELLIERDFTEYPDERPRIR